MRRASRSVLSTVTTRTSVRPTGRAAYAPRRACGREAPLSSNRFERKPGVRTSLIGLQRRGALDVEARAVALLDRGHRGRLPAPGERPDDREPGRHGRDLGQHERERAGPDRRDQQRPQPVEHDAARVDLGQRRLHPRARQQRRDRRGGLSAPSEPDADERRDQPPAGGERNEQVVARRRSPRRASPRRARVAAAALIRTVVRRKSENRIAARASIRHEHRQQLLHALGPVDDEIGLIDDLRRPVLGADPDADRAWRSRPPRPSAPASGRRRGRSRRRRRTGRRRPGSRRGTSAIPAPLSIRTGGRTSSTLRPQWVRRPAAVARSAIASIAERAASSSRRAAPVEGDDRALVLETHAQPAQIGGVGLAAEVLDPPRPVLERWVEHGLRSTRP